MIYLDSNFIKTKKGLENYKDYVCHLMAGLECNGICAYDRAVCDNSKIYGILFEYERVLRALEKKALK